MRFTDVTDALAKEELELEAQGESLDKTSEILSLMMAQTGGSLLSLGLNKPDEAEASLKR